jgi:hypothetical protein
MKLQIFETNAKDMLDITTLFVDQELTEDDTGINMPYIERLTRSDWGLWKTITMVAEKTRPLFTIRTRANSPERRALSHLGIPGAIARVGEIPPLETAGSDRREGPMV